MSGDTLFDKLNHGNAMQSVFRIFAMDNLARWVLQICLEINFLVDIFVLIIANIDKGLLNFRKQNEV